MVILAVGALTFGAFAAMAHRSPEEMMQKRLDHMKTALNLSDAQVNQIKAIYQQNTATFKADRDAVKAAAKGSDAKKAAFQKMRTDMQGVQAQVKNILTPEQQQKWEAERAKHEGHEGHGHWGKKGEGNNEAAPSNK